MYHTWSGVSLKMIRFAGLPACLAAEDACSMSAIAGVTERGSAPKQIQINTHEQTITTKKGEVFLRGVGTLREVFVHQMSLRSGHLMV